MYLSTLNTNCNHYIQKCRSPILWFDYNKNILYTIHSTREFYKILPNLQEGIAYYDGNNGITLCNLDLQIQAPLASIYFAHKL
jgi:hypothetical protein